MEEQKKIKFFSGEGKNGWKGVTKEKGRFRVRITIAGKVISAGSYKTLEEAITKRKELENSVGTNPNKVVKDNKLKNRLYEVCPHCKSLVEKS